MASPWLSTNPLGLFAPPPDGLPPRVANPFDWKSALGAGEYLLTPDHAPPPRPAVVQAILAQQQPYMMPTEPHRTAPRASPVKSVADGMKLYGDALRSQYAEENIGNRAAGLNPTAPAFDDQGYALPRALGMAQPNGGDQLSNWWWRTFGQGSQ